MSQAIRDRQRSECIVEAAKLVAANAGAAEQLLTEHRPKADGRCDACGSHLIHWPCVLVVIAREAQELVARQPDEAARCSSGTPLSREAGSADGTYLLAYPARIGGRIDGTPAGTAAATPPAAAPGSPS